MSPMIPSRLASTSKREAGAVLPLIMLLMLVLFGFAAIGVDLTAAYAEKRQAQSEADAAVIAGALMYLDAGNATPDAVIDQVVAFAAPNAPGFVPVKSDWNITNCQDTTKPVDYNGLVDSNGIEYDCISLKQVDDAPTLLRVKTPNWDMPTSFARLIGFDVVTVSATATAELRYQSALPILPFSVPADPSLEECMATAPSGLLPGDTSPCSGPAQGNFGLIDSPWFGAGTPHFTTEDPCPGDPNFNVRAPHNLAYGLDHIITEWPDPDSLPAVGITLSGNHVGADSCDNAQTGVIPYVVNTQTGNTQSPAGKALLQDGFLGNDPSSTSGSLPGRLRQPSSPGLATPIRMNFVTNSTNYDVDNVGLWEYLVDYGQDSSDQCHPSQFTPSGKEGRALTTQIIACLNPVGTGTPQFDLDIVHSPRFAVVPVLNYAVGSQYGNKWWAVLEMRPVYLQATWYECTNAADAECLFLPDDFKNATGFDPTDKDDYSVLFYPGEAPQSQGPCYLNAGSCVTPLASRFQLMGLSAVLLDWDDIPGAEDQLGGNSPFQVFLHTNE